MSGRVQAVTNVLRRELAGLCARDIEYCRRIDFFIVSKGIVRRLAGRIRSAARDDHAGDERNAT